MVFIPKWYQKQKNPQIPVPRVSKMPRPHHMYPSSNNKKVIPVQCYQSNTGQDIHLFENLEYWRSLLAFPTLAWRSNALCLLPMYSDLWSGLKSKMLMQVQEVTLLSPLQNGWYYQQVPSTGPENTDVVNKNVMDDYELCNGCKAACHGL
jgi:hypothetical protein